MRNLIFKQLVFCRAVALKSIRESARSCSLSSGEAQELIRELEREVKGRLLKVQEDKVLPTDLGKSCFEKWRFPVEELLNLAGCQKQERLKNIFRVDFPTTSGATIFTPLAADFAASHPSVTFDIRFTHGSFHPLWDGTDLRIVHGPYYLEDVEQRFLGAVRRIIVVSPEYAKAENLQVSRPEDLKRPDVVGTRDMVETGSIRLRKGRKIEKVTMRPRILIRNHFGALSVALANQGIAAGVPERVAKPYLERGELIRVLPEWDFPPLTLRAVWPKFPPPSPIITDLVEFFENFLAKEEISRDAYEADFNF